MTNRRLTLKPADFIYDFDPDLSLPAEWLDLISRLHPLTACVVWGVLTGCLSPAVVELASSSPDLFNFKSVQVLAEADPLDLAPALTESRAHLDEIFIQILPDDPRRIIH